MSKPSIQQTGNAAAPKGGCMKYIWGGAAVAALGAAALALSQCGEEAPTEQPPEKTWVEGKVMYKYKVTGDTELRGKGKTVLLEDASCVTTIQNDDGTTPALRNNDQDIEVTAQTPDGVVQGLVSRYNIRDVSYDSPCPATIVKPPAQDVQETTGPVGQWRTMQSVNVYNVADATSAVFDRISSANCVESTGKVRGDFMEVSIDNGLAKRNFWVQSENLKPTQVAICQAKIDFGP